MDKEKIDGPKGEFLDRYSEISVRQLVPDNINNYLEDALNDLIKLREDIREKHKWNSLVNKDWEDQAFKEEGLPDIGEKLDKIASEIDVLWAIDARLKNLPEEDHVFLFADKDNIPKLIEPNDNNGKDGDLSKPKPDSILPLDVTKKTKTILFILNQAFGEDIEKIDIAKGKKETRPDDPKWFRQYYRIDAPSQNKFIFSCDEKNNITFVIDKDDMAKIKNQEGRPITIGELERMKKSEVNKLIKNMPNSKRLVFRNNFSDNIKRAIANRPLLDDDLPPTESCYI